MLTKPQVFYDDTHKQALGYQNPFYLKKARRIKPTLYDGSLISSQYAVIPVIDDEETLILEEESRSKMLAKQNDPISKEKKISTTLINYVELNRLFEYFGKRFVPQQELSTEQAFWLQTSHPNTDQYDISPVKIEAPMELPKTNSVLKFIRNIFFLNDRLLQQIMSQDVMLCVMNSTAVFGDSVNLEMKKSESCNKCLDLEAELVKTKNMVEQDVFTKLSNSFAKLEKHCISLELDIQLNKQIFQKDKSCNNQNALEIQEYFENNDLKAQLQAKDTTIHKLKEHIKSMMENNKEEKVKQEMDEIETINIELEHRLKCSTSTCRSQPTGNNKNDRISQTPNSNIKNKVEVQRRRVKSKSNKKNRVKDPICDANVKHTMLNANSELILLNVNNHNVWKPTGKVFTEVGHKWKPTGRLFTIVGNSYPLTMITLKKIVHPKETTSNSVKTQKPEIKVYSRRPKQVKTIGSSKKAKIVESKIANNSKPNHSWGSNATDVPSSSSLVNDRLSRLFSGTVRFENDQIAKIMGYGDYQLGNVTISRVYYVEGLGHNLFSVGQFCDSDLEVAFQKNTCFIRNLDGVDLLSGSRDTNLYTISLDDMLKTSPICLLSKASKTKSWLWHRQLSHLNFGTLNKLAKDGLARGIPKLKFKKDHLCSACALGKSKKSSHQPKAEDTNQEKLYLLHMDLCGPMRVESINGKKYILLMHDKKPDLSFLHVFGSPCYPTNDSEDLGKLNAKADIGPGLQFMTPATSNSGLVPNPIHQQSCIPPTRNDWDRLFQPMFDEYFNPPPSAISIVQEASTPRAVCWSMLVS
ncbi:retrovirus-related pol polyprotein from transposon TNT 1-94 [Tanacetum coccineum]